MQNDEIAALLGSQITGIYSYGEDSISWVLDSGQVITFEGAFEIYLEERILQ